MNDSIDIFGLTDIGKSRDSNQDQFLVAEVQTALAVDQSTVPCESLDLKTAGHLLAVADGMGGHQNGEEASSIAIACLREYLASKWQEAACSSNGHGDDVCSNLAAGFEYAHERLSELARDQPESTRMGTTLTAAVVCWPTLHLAHAGDSRCYLLRGSRSEQITSDHTLAEHLSKHRLGRSGMAARASHILTNCLGGSTEKLVIEHKELGLQPSDIIVLCSDGLTKYIRNDQLLTTIAECESSEESCRKLVDLANSAGGSDNITVIVARCSADDTDFTTDDIVNVQQPPTPPTEENLQDTAPYFPG